MIGWVELGAAGGWHDAGVARVMCVTLHAMLVRLMCVGQCEGAAVSKV